MSEVAEPEGARALRWVHACAAGELPGDGEGLALELAGQRVALFEIDGRLHAVGDECPHQGASLGLGVVLGGEVTCPWHGWHFDLAGGSNTDGLDCRVEVFEARRGPGGAIEVRLPAAP